MNYTFCRHFLPLLISFLTLTFSAIANNCKVFTSERDLSSCLINQVYQDKDGVVWISTEDGLNRYDGAKFTIFRRNDDDTTSLLNNFVRFVFEDSKNRFFVGTLSGLQLYDRATRKFIRIQPFIAGQLFEHGINVSSITELANGDIIIGTSAHGIFKLIVDGDKMVLSQDTSIVPNTFYIEKMYRDSKDNLWVVSLDRGILMSDNNFNIQSIYRVDSKETLFSVKEGIDGNIYVGTSKGRLICYDFKSRQYRIIENKKNTSAILDILPEDSTTLLIGTDGDGLKLYNTATNEWTDYQMSLLGLSREKLKVHSIIRDFHDNLWLGCFQQGVLLLPAVHNNFTYLGSRSSLRDYIGSCCVTAVHYDKDGNYWVGTDNDGVYLLNNDLSLKRHYEIGNSSTMVPRTCLTILKDSRQNVWIGSYLEGLVRLDERTGKCERIPLRNLSNGLNLVNVYCILEDNDKNIWIGISGSGLCKLNPETLETTLYETVLNDADYSLRSNVLPNDWINTMLLVDNKLYLGTYDGFGCLDLETNNFASTFGVNKLLQGEVVYAMHQDIDKNIWFGTSNGLYKFNPLSQKFSRLSVADGLPNNLISSIQSDSEGNLWISTNKGLSYMVRDSSIFANYYASDGLLCNEFSKNASCVGKNGLLAFGGISGLVCFNPQEITKYYSTPQVKIIDFFIHNEPVTKGALSGKKTIVDCDITKATELDLSYSDNSFSIEFSAMEFANPERIIYMYSIDGSDWICLQPGNNKVSFSNIKPGKHIFRVRANDTNSLSEIKSLTINVAAPWYSTKLAYICYLLLFLITIMLWFMYLQHSYTMQKNLMEHQHAKDINEAKLQFFINISHEIRTPMTLIMGPLSKLIENETEGGKLRTYKTIYRNASRILDLVNQLMDIRKIDKGQMKVHFEENDIVQFIKSICQTFEYQSSVQNIDLKCVSSQEQIKMWFDPNNLDKVIINILSNAFKFTPNGNPITINVITGIDGNVSGALSNYVEIDIADKGPGIKEDEQKYIFDRFYQSSNSRNMTVSGTGVGLHLTRSLVELHHGTITVANNNDGAGCHFTIRLPLGNKHLTEEEMADTTEIETIKRKVIFDDANDDVATTKVYSKTKFKVVLVEDDDEIRQYIKSELASDFHIIECTNGIEALEAIFNKVPDLVISDVMMPQMDGLTLCQKIKKNILTNSVPVVLLTALTGDDKHIEGLDVGADAYITKPFSIEILRHTVQNILKSRLTLKNNFTGNQSQESMVKKIQVDSPDDKLMQRVMKVVNANLGNPELSVEMIAQAVGISRVHLHRKLKEITNQTTRDFIKNIRLQQAAVLLSEKRHSIVEIASIVGFANVTYFSSSFKDLYGMAPSEYMDQQISKLNSKDTPDTKA